MKEHLHTVLIGGSAGSIDLSIELLKGFKKHPNTGVVLILHRGVQFDSELHHVLARAIEQPVVEAEHGMKLSNGVYLAPSGFHLLLGDDGCFYLDDSEKVHFSRPSVDVSLESFSSVLGKEMTGVILSGSSCDGAEGIHSLLERNGEAMVIDPNTVEHKIMPESVLQENAEHCEVKTLKGIRKRLEEKIL